MNFAVLFDMDGVIVDSNPYHRLAFQSFLKQHNIVLSEDELKTKVFGRTNKEIMSYIFKEDVSLEQTEAWADEKEAIFRDLYKGDIKAVRGLLPFLQSLKANGIATAVGTSAPLANLDFVLDILNIRQYFDVLIHSKDVTHGKPHPEVYLKAADLLRVDVSQCIVIEDSLPGVQAGLNAGMKVIGITTTHTPQELQDTDLVIQDFEGMSVEKIQAVLRA
ncbi:HAD family phosphatase [Cesiribacter sp. SM1]|uniref:HAD family hydrolase n=1 Tax=Cesiribacter sp. SM1 TaxID=2861196 RepID=UPI001CD5DA2D|nr:HAD family phosphatase [Cesiribacter sp. SM1]